MDRKKTVHQVETPFSAVQWPHIAQDDQDTILELLCGLLSPLGHHRKSYVNPSKGKRARYRKRKQPGSEAQEPSSLAASPPTPEIGVYVDLGLSSISRSLAKMPNPEPYAVIFVARSGQPSAFHAHFPQMVAVASNTTESIRLVGFSRACEERLSSCLGIPRVSSIGLREGLPQTKALVEFVRQHVSPVEMLWKEEATSGNFLPTNIKAVEVPIGAKKQKTA